jgi:hypothetical protein
MKNIKPVPFQHVQDAKTFTSLAHLTLVRNPSVPMFQDAAAAASTSYTSTRRAYLAQDEASNYLLDAALAGLIEESWVAEVAPIREAKLQLEDAQREAQMTPYAKGPQQAVMVAQSVYQSLRTEFLVKDQSANVILDGMLS